MANILQAADEGAKKTHIMYQCNLSFRQLNAYLEFLAEMGFLQNKVLKAENKDGSQLYKATQKGKEFIKAYHTLKALLVS
jgi:predicted transcriptional regulator